MGLSVGLSNIWWCWCYVNFYVSVWTLCFLTNCWLSKKKPWKKTEESRGKWLWVRVCVSKNVHLGFTKVREERNILIAVVDKSFTSFIVKQRSTIALLRPLPPLSVDQVQWLAFYDSTHAHPVFSFVQNTFIWLSSLSSLTTNFTFTGRSRI